MLQEFKDFIFRGNALALAIGVMVAGAFQKLIDAVMTYLLNPILGLILGGLDLTEAIAIPLKAGKPFAEGVPTIGIGAILGTIITFVITMAVLFMIAKAAAKDALTK